MALRSKAICAEAISMAWFSSFFCVNKVLRSQNAARSAVLKIKAEKNDEHQNSSYKSERKRTPDVGLHMNFVRLLVTFGASKTFSASRKISER